MMLQNVKKIKGATDKNGLENVNVNNASRLVWGLFTLPDRETDDQ